jgi:cyclopropane fatty-acyl-phospholipid synthase-like methyltransferase
MTSMVALIIRVFVAPAFFAAAFFPSVGLAGEPRSDGLGDQLSARAPDIYFSPTPDAVADAMLKLAGVGPDDVVYDLGSGDGRIVIMAAQKYGARAVGIELEPYLLDISRRVARERDVADKVTFIEEDLFTADISKATVVTLYLSPSVNKRLEDKLKRELRPGTRIVSHQFGIGSWIPKETIRAANGNDLFLWTVPRRPARTPDIWFTPTEQDVVYSMLKLARVGPDDVVYDLGSGDGRIVILAAQEYGARGVGIEIDPPLVEISREVAREARLEDKVTFIEGDLFTTDISKATVVTIFLSLTVNRQLEEKLRRELRPGTRIVSHQFPIGSWTPDTVVRAPDGTDLYLWTIPAR